MKRRFNKVMVAAAVLMIAALVMVQFNRTGNLHYHVDDSGRVVSHSHPYNKNDDSGPVKTHSHGKHNLTIPSGAIDMSVAEWSPVTVQAPSLEVIQIYAYLVSREQDGLHPIRGRAPPSLTI
ncbi:MAG: hypothetical protein R6W67_01980 [Bacteroidales bacterium]